MQNHGGAMQNTPTFLGQKTTLSPLRGRKPHCSVTTVPSCSIAEYAGAMPPRDSLPVQAGPKLGSTGLYRTHACMVAGQLTGKGLRSSACSDSIDLLVHCACVVVVAAGACHHACWQLLDWKPRLMRSKGGQLLHVVPR